MPIIDKAFPSSDEWSKFRLWLEPEGRQAFMRQASRSESIPLLEKSYFAALLGAITPEDATYLIKKLEKKEADWLAKKNMLSVQFSKNKALGLNTSICAQLGSIVLWTSLSSVILFSVKIPPRRRKDVSKEHWSSGAENGNNF